MTEVSDFYLHQWTEVANDVAVGNDLTAAAAQPVYSWNIIPKGSNIFTQ